jgi:hypothetical protein
MGECAMDKLSKWSAHLCDLLTLFSEWERRRIDGHKWTKRFREIHSVCMFTLCIENGTDQRYMIGFQQHGVADVPVTVNQLFSDNFGEIEDCDILLVDDPKSYGASTVLHHRCQLVSYIHQPSTSEADFVSFLEHKKLRVAPDDDLRLIIHVEQEGHFNFAFLSAYLCHRIPSCPYSQVFAFGQNRLTPRVWFCVQVYPQLAIFPELTEEVARSLVLDREQYNKPKSK